MSKTIKVPKQLFRTATVERGMDGDTDSFRLSISSDTPYLRYDWWNDEEYYEVLDHGPGGVDDTRLKAGLPVLFNHDRDQHLGRAQSFENSGKKISLKDIKWSESDFAQSKKKDMESGALPDTSVGYQITDEGTCIGAQDGIPVYKFKWAPYEGSLVTIPADITVGAGRNHQREHKPTEEPQEIVVNGEIPVDLLRQTRKNDTVRNTVKDNLMLKKPGLRFHEPDKGDNPSGGGAATMDATREREDAVKAERQRVADINGYMTAFKIEGMKTKAADLARQAIEKGTPFDDFRKSVMDNWDQARAIETPNPEIGMTKKERREYSVVKLLRDMAEHGSPQGLEKEASDTARKLYKKEGAGITIPDDMLRANLAEDNDLSRSAIEAAAYQMRAVAQMQQRFLNASTGASGGYLIGTELLTGSIIELLRNKTIVMGLGPTILSGLTGNIAIPKVTGGAAVYWLAEGASMPESDQTFAQLALTPHRMGADTAYTKQLVAQASLSVEAFVRDDIAKQMAIEADRVCLVGLGVQGEPLGIANTIGVQAVTFGGTPNYLQLVNFETAIEVSNANLGSIAYLTTPAAKGSLKTKLQVPASAFPVYLFQPQGDGPVINGQRPGSINGYPAYSSNNVPGNRMFGGVWSELIIAMWAGIDVVVDPYSLKKSEQIEVTVHQWMDTAVRHPVAFVVSTDSAAQ